MLSSFPYIANTGKTVVRPDCQRLGNAGRSSEPPTEAYVAQHLLHLEIDQTCQTSYLGHISEDDVGDGDDYVEVGNDWSHVEVGVEEIEVAHLNLGMIGSWGVEEDQMADQNCIHDAR